MALRSTTNPVIRLLRLQLICGRLKALSSDCVGSLSAMVSNIDWIAFVKPLLGCTVGKVPDGQEHQPS